MATIRYAGPAIEATANGAIGIAKAVAVIAGAAILADKDNAAHRHNVRGLAIDNYSDSQTAAIQVGGRFVYVGWSWTPDLPVYLDAAGGLTQTRPSSGFIQQIGVAESATEIYVALAPPEDATSKHLHLREQFTLSGSDVANKYVLLAQTPLEPGSVQLYVEGAGFQNQATAYQMDGANPKKLEWPGLSLDGVLSAGDVIVARYYKGVT